MNIIDSHIHINELLNISGNAYANIVPSIKFEEWALVENLYKSNHKAIIPAFGIHPWYVKEAPENWQKKLEEILIKYPNALIGETGLDRIKDNNYNPQNDFFKIHIKLAKKYKRPIIIHAVKCTEWLEEYWGELKEIKFVFHSFNGKKELLKKIIDNGGYVSVSGSILNNKEKEKVLQEIPLDRILIETDGPYNKGNIEDIAKDVADVLGIEYEKFVDITYNNTMRFLSFI